MQGPTVGDIATAVGVVAAIAIGIHSNALTRKGQKEEQARGLASAERSESAARLTEEYTRRVVDVLETMAKGEPNGGTSQVVPRVRWTLAHSTNGMYLLTNIGDAIACDVEIESDKSLPLLNLPPRQDVGSADAIEFIAARTFGTRDSTIKVKWADDSGQRIWKYPLPPERD
jgi:hypothetical protein